MITASISLRAKLGLSAALFCLAVVPAQAQLTLTFLPTTFPNALPGQQLTIQATLTNLTGELVDLGTAGGSVVGPGAPGITWEDTDFILNLPNTLANGASYSANLYLDVEPAAPDGEYTTTYTLTGVGQTTTDNYDATAFALVIINSGGGGGGIVPEPTTLALMGLGGFLALRRGRRSQ